MMLAWHGLRIIVHRCYCNFQSIGATDGQRPSDHWRGGRVRPCCGAARRASPRYLHQPREAEARQCRQRDAQRHSVHARQILAEDGQQRRCEVEGPKGARLRRRLDEAVRKADLSACSVPTMGWRRQRY